MNVTDRSDNVALSDKHQAELELVLIGYALADKEHAERIHNVFANNEMTKISNDLVRSIHSRDRQAVLNWLEARGAVVEKGKLVIDAIVDRIKSEVRRRQVKRLYDELGYSVKIGTQEEQRKILFKLLDEMGGRDER